MQMAPCWDEGFFPPFSFLFRERVSCIPGWLWTHYVAKDDLELPVSTYWVLKLQGNATLPGFMWSWDQTQGHKHAKQAL